MKQVSTQINVDYGAERVIAIERLAAKQSISRADLLRKGFDEMDAADQEGREPFRHGTPEFGADEGRHLMREVRVLTTELERSTRDNAKLMAELKKMIAVFQQDAATARERAAREVAEGLEQALEPFRAEVAALKEENAKLQAGFEAALANQPRLDAIDERLAKVEDYAKQPRNEYSIVLGRDAWSLAALMLAVLSLLVAGGFMSFMLAGVWHGFGMAFVDRAVPGNQGICELIDYRTGYSDCRVPGVHDEAPAPTPLSIETPAPEPRHLHHRHRR